MDQRIPSAGHAASLPHGGRLRAARARFPNAPEPFIDLSTGINPLPYPIPVLPHAAWTRLPEPEEIGELEATAARAYGALESGLVVAAAGTQTLIALLPLIFRPERVAILSPTYGEYARAVSAAGIPCVTADRLDELRLAPSAVLCNPNNPDGRSFGAETLLDFVESSPPGALTIVDEAFADLDGESLVPHLPRPGLVVLRSFSKAYGLGGLRLAFACGAADLLDPLRTALGSWPVSGPAVEIGTKALEDRDWLDAARARLAADSARLDALLRGAGFEIVGGTLLFRLAANAHAAAIERRLGEAGILVRSFDAHPKWLRFGIPGTEDQWNRLAAALT